MRLITQSIWIFNYKQPIKNTDNLGTLKQSGSQSAAWSNPTIKVQSYQN